MTRIRKRLLSAAIFLAAVLLVVIKIVGSRDEDARRARPVPRVTADTARIETIRRALRFTGDVNAIQQTAVYAKVGGTLERVYARIGDRVAAGRILARIDTTELAQQAGQAAATYRNARLNHARVAELAAQNLVAKQELDNAAAALDIARAAYDNARTRLGYAVIAAPFSGYITARMLDPGAVVTTSNATLFTLMDIDAVKVLVNVLEKDIPLVAKGMRAAVTVDAYPDRTFEGTVARFSEALDLGTRTMPVEIDIPNGGHVLKSGMFATVELAIDAHAGALTVPTQAVMTDDAGRYVFAVDTGVVHRKAVTVGIEGDVRSEILSGLRAGEVVVTSGQQLVRDGGSVTVAR